MGPWLAVMFSVALGVSPHQTAKAPKSKPGKLIVMREDETMGTDACVKKRVDGCGCHRVFGRRHCHPNRRTEACEAYAADHSRVRFDAKIPAIARDSRLSSESPSALVEATDALSPSGEISRPTGAELLHAEPDRDRGRG